MLLCVAAAVGAAAGMAAERVVVGRPLRRGETPGGRLGLGQLRGTSADRDARRRRRSCTSRSTSRVRTLPWRDLTVVFVHGYALNQDCFHFQRLALRGTARLVFYDQRSHGRSGRGSPESATLQQLAADLDAVLDACRPPVPSSWSDTRWAA